MKARKRRWVRAAVLCGLAACSLHALAAERFFTITLMVPIGNEPRELAAQVLARDLEKIGIGVNLRYMENAAISARTDRGGMTGATFDQGGFDLTIGSSKLDAELDPSGMYARFACDQFVPDGSNIVRYCNPEFDALIYEALSTPDSGARWALCREASRVLHEDLPMISMYFPANFYALAASVTFPEHHDLFKWQTYALRWAARDLGGRAASAREKTLVVAISSDVNAFLSGYTTSGYVRRSIEYMAYDGLFMPPIGSYARGPVETRGLRGALARAWEISDDGMSIKVHLREDVTWHDGAPFNADDVVFTYDLIVDPEAGYGSSKFIVDNGVTWRKVDDYTVEFSCATFNPLFLLEIFDWSILPAHLLGSVPRRELARSEYNTGTVVGTGPWVLVDYKPGEYIRYKANEGYYAGRPWFDYVVFRIIPQATSAWLALTTGEVDVTDLWYGFTRELSTIEASPALYAIMEPAFGAQQLRINMEHPILSNVWVRRAISYAINRTVMAQVISGGLATVALQLLPEESPGYNPTLPPYVYDLNEAKRCLQRAGYDYSTIGIAAPPAKK